MVERTKEELLQTWRDNFDEGYTIPIEEEDEGRGADLIYAMAAMGARSSQAGDVSTQAMFIREHSIQTNPTASGAIQATATVLLSRVVPTQGDLTLRSGDIIEIYQKGTKGEEIIVFEAKLIDDSTLAIGSSGVSADVRAVRPGYQANGGILRSARFKGRSTSNITATTSGTTLTDSGLGDRFTEDMDQDGFVKFISGANGGIDPRRILTSALGSITVEGAALTSGTDVIQVVGLNELGTSIEIDGEFSGGTHAILDLLGSDILLGRNPSETDESYRKRIGALPDIDSPNAVIRAASRILRPLDIPFVFGEVKNQSDVRGFYADVDPCDVTTDSVTTNGRVTLGNAFEFNGFFLIVERRGTGEFGMPSDTVPATSGYPDNAADVGFSDGYPIGFASDMMALINEIEKTKMGGVPWALILVNNILQGV